MGVAMKGSQTETVIKHVIEEWRCGARLVNCAHCGSLRAADEVNCGNCESADYTELKPSATVYDLRRSS